MTRATSIWPQRLGRLLPLLCLPLIGLAASGCSILDPVPSQPFEAAPAADAEVAEAADPLGSPDEAVTVEFRVQGKQPQRMRMPLESGMVVQDALVQSGAIKRFRRMQINIIRSLPHGAGKHNLEVTYNHRKRGVEPHFDYALHAGDRVVIFEDTSDTLDDMLGTLGPFAR